MSNQSTNDNTAQNLTDQDLDMVVGGASAFLKGKVVATLSTNYQVAEIRGGYGGPGNLAARSQTTLGCWEDCTVGISSC